MNEKLKQFAELKARIKVLEDEAEVLKPQVLAAMEEQKLDQAEITGIGMLSLASLKKWTYPEALVRAEEDLKTEKKTAEQTGDATFTESRFIKFTVLKREGKE